MVVIYEIRYALAKIMWKGADIGATTTPTAAYALTNFYMTDEKITFEDDYYGMALSALKTSEVIQLFKKPVILLAVRLL